MLRHAKAATWTCSGRPLLPREARGSPTVHPDTCTDQRQGDVSSGHLNKTPEDRECGPVAWDRTAQGQAAVAHRNYSYTLASPGRSSKSPAVLKAVGGEGKTGTETLGSTPFSI